MENEEIDETMATLMDAVNLICTVEDEYVHQDIQCDTCSQPIVGRRFRCSKCEDFDLCSQCRSNGFGDEHDPDHLFYPIQYRRLFLPPANGEDFALLQKFDQATTSMSFYLHYPWFFGPPIFEKLVVGTPNEEESRALLVQLEESLDGIHLQVALDGVIRLLAPEDWNWRQVQDHVKPLLELQLVRAQSSSSFYQLYHALESQSNVAQSAPNINSSEVLRLRKLLFDTDLDRNSVQGCKDALKVFIASRSSGDGFADLSIPADKISESAKYMEMLSRGFDLNSAFLPIFEEVEALLKLRRPGSPDREWSISKSMQTWQEYTIAYSSILARVEQYLDQSLRRVTDMGNNSCYGSLQPQPSDAILDTFTHLILCRQFKAAQQLISGLDNLNPLHVLKIMCFYELTGAVSEACHIAHSAVERFHVKAQIVENFIWNDIFMLCEVYFSCFTHGRWTEAIVRAIATLDQIASISETLLSFENCVLELYCFKIFLLAAKDRNDLLQPEIVSSFTTRLRYLRESLNKFGAQGLALHVFDIELRVRQEEEMIFELEQTESLRHRRVLVVKSEPAVRSLEDFLFMLSKHQDSENLGREQAAVEASARLLFGYALAENELDDLTRTIMKKNLCRVWQLFELCDSSLGKAEAALLSLRYYTSLDTADLPGWNGIEACFKAQSYFKGLIKFHEFQAADKLDTNPTKDETLSASLLPTGPSLYRKLLPIAEEMGDKLLFRNCRVRSMRSWIEGPTFIMLCENVFHPDTGLLGDELFLEASRLLSQLYEVNNNFIESSAFALLHLRLAHARQDHVLLDLATTLYFRCIGNMVSTKDDADRIYEVASLAFSFDRTISRLCHPVLAQMESSDFVISAGSLPIESLLWPVQLVRHIVEDDGIQSMSPQLISVVYRSIKLAVDLFLLLPREFHGLFFSKICEALGLAAEMLANPILSLLCYNLGQSQLVAFDGYMRAVLQLRIGRRITSWIYTDRSNFLALQEVAFAYLDQAVDFFWGEYSRQSSYRNGLESSLVLARAHLREVQFLIENADWGEHNDAEDEDLTEEQQANKKRLQGHFEAGLSPIQRAIAGNLVLRRQLGSLPAMQALENSRLFYFGDMEELYWNEMGLEMDKSRITRDPEPLLVAIQKWKAVSLRDTISRRLKYDTPAPESVAYGQPWSSNVNIPETLYPVIEPPEFEEKLIWGMAEIAEAHLEAGQSIVFVDWTRYYDTLFMVAYDGTEGRIKKAVLEIDYHAIETWVHSELGVSSLHQGRTNRKRLHKSSRLKDLRPILEKLEGFVKPKDLLVFCPTGILHAVPLQAIPFGSKGKPLIASNPVVFCPSLSLLQTCVASVQNSPVLSSLPAAAITRLGPGDAQEEVRMFETAQKGLADGLLQASFTSGEEATRDVFMNRSRGTRLLHYHGHAYLEAAQRRDRALQLEPRKATMDLPQNDGLLTVMDIFDLKLDSAVVVLLACASGEDDVAPNDDPLGLLSAFLYAGASSVIATRWPTQTSDARDFAETFYQKAFSSRKDGTVNLALAVQAAVLELWENWDEDDPYHWAQFQLHGCWFGKL